MPTITQIKVGERAKTITLPVGKALTIMPTPGSFGTAGVAYLLDPELGGSNSKQSWEVGASALAPISGFATTQKVLISCSAGGIDAVVDDVSAISRKPIVSGVPVIMAPNGNWTSNNGLFNLVTPLPALYSGGAWVRFSAAGANGSSGGPSASKLYWCVFTSVAGGQAYDVSIDPATPFVPDVPAGPLTKLPTVVGAHMQATGVEIALLNLLIPGGSMGNRGAILFNALVQTTNAAENKMIRTKFGGTNYYNASFGSGLASLPVTTKIFNCGVPNQQVGTPGNTGTGFTGSSNALARGSADTLIDQSFLATGQMASGLSYIIFDASSLEWITQ